MSQLPAGLSELSREEKLALLARLARERSGPKAAEPTSEPVDAGPRSYPLAFAQQRFWFLDQLDPGSFLDVVFRALRLSGPLDGEALRRALGELVRRHEALRTRFPVEGGEPRQVVEPELPGGGPVLPLVDLSGLAAQEAAAFAREEARRPFDLARGPLFRARLLRLGEQQHALLLAVHHIVCDGWSLGLLLREVALLYGAFVAGEPSPLTAPRARFGDFARWQRERLQGAALAEELAFWRGRLQGAPPVLELPADRPRRQASGCGDVVPFQVPEAAAARLKQIAQAAGATPFMALLALFDVLLFRYTGQEDFVVGVPVANRNRTEMENVVGCFSSNLLVRAELRRSTSFRELLARVRSEALAVFAHSDLPFEKLVEELQPERHLSHNPLFQVMFALQNTASGTLSMPGLALSPLAVERGLAKLDLTLEMTERDSVLAGYFEYNTDLFDRATVERMARHFLRLLDGAVADPDRGIGDLPWLDADELRRVGEWSAGPAQPEPPLPVHRAFEESARRAPAAAAVVWNGEALPYAELDRRANRLARHLRRLGVGPEVRVGLCLERSFEMAAALLAVLKAGGAYVPLDPAYPRERLQYLVEDSELRVLLTMKGLVERLPQVPLVLALDGPAGERPWEGEAAEAPGVEVHPESAAYVIYTSGSTGRPKGVPVPHRALANHAAATAARYGLGPQDRVLQFASLSFDIAGEEIFPTWRAGAALVPRPAALFPSFPELERMIASRGITVANLPTPYWHEWTAELSRAGSAPPAPLRLVIVGTEQASAGRLAEWLAVAGGVRWINAYGPTEATVTATAHEGAVASGGPRVPVGTPIAGVRAHVLDDGLQPVPPGIPGELCLGGAGIARGYLNRPGATAAAFVPDPYASEPGLRLYRTGDRARFLPSGEIELLGRGDDQVKIRGFRVEPGEVETVLAGHPGAKDAAVIARDDGPGGVRLVGYAVPADGTGADAEQLRAFLRERLPEHMVPSALVLLPEMPLTPSGKVDRRALPAPAPETGAGEDFVPPRGPVEEVIAAIWADVLRRDRIGAGDNFFASGGHSLLATQVVSRVREALGVELPLRAVFEAPTVAGLAEAVEAARRAAEGGQVATSAPVAPVPRTGGLPCSSAQERLWVLDRLHPDSPVYNMPLALRLRGGLDESALERALEEILRRHESLRTTFAAVAGQPVQAIAPPAPFSLPRIDLSNLADPEAAAQRWVFEDALRPFELSRGPLFRCALLRLGREDHLLAANMHHIVSDGWSIGVLLRELGALYAAFLRGEPSPLAEPPVQYADFAVWQRERLQGEVLERQVELWRSRLAGAPVAIELPADRPRPAVQTSRGGRARIELAAGLVRSLEALARARGATLFMTLLAGFQALLGRLSGQDDVLVGTPVAGRVRRELEGVVGLFVNTLVLRADLSGQPAFGELMAQVRERALEAYTHQDVPFERLVEELRPERHLSHNPIFQVLFALHHAAGAPLALPGLAVSLPLVDSRTSQFDLYLSLSEAGEELRGHLVYNADLFDGTTVERFASHLQELLAGAVAAPETPAAELPLLTAAERRQLVETWNDTAAEIPAATIHELLERAAARRPGAIALVPEVGGPLTYAELNARANRLGCRLRDLGVGPGSVVALYLERSAGMVAALLGVLKSGGAYLPLDPGHPRERLAWVLQDSGAAVLIADPGSEPPPCEGVRVLTLEESGGEAAEDLPPLAGPEDVAYVLYTSGSTGRPKGVEVRHRGMVNFLASMAREPGLGPDDVLVAVTTISFDIAGLELWLPLSVGARVALAGRETAADGARLAALLRDQGATALQATPATWRLLLATGWKGSPRLKAICGGEALTSELAAELAPRVGALWNVYGPTETTVWSTLRRVDAAGDGGPVPIGRPIANTTAHVLDRRLAPVPVGVAGELYLGGEGLARGYLRRPDLTAERFVPDPFSDRGRRLYRTGDLVRRLPSGEIAFLGRADHQVKVRGYRIELGEVEAALERLPAVRQAVAGVREEAAGNPQLVAWLVPADGAAPIIGELREALRRELPDYMVPGVFVQLEAFPLTPSGKVDRKALPAPDGARPDLGGSYVAPQGPVQEKLAAIWAEVLRLARVGARDSFFELGGHSLMATQVLARVQEEFGVELPLRDMFESPTVAGLAERIVQKELERADSDLLAKLLAAMEGQAV